MKPYFDSGVLIKLYVREPNSPDAACSVRRFRSVVLNPLQELEIRNTFRALEGRGIITPVERAASEHALETDIISGRLGRLAPDWAEVFRISVQLCHEHTADTLARSLDILHVAAAVVGEADLFVTADDRQAAVARKTGLQTEVIE